MNATHNDIAVAVDEVHTPLSSRADRIRRAGLLTMLTASALTAVMGARLALAAPLDATEAAPSMGAQPGELALRIGAQSERLFDAAMAGAWPAIAAARQALNEQVGHLDQTFDAEFAAARGRAEVVESARAKLHVELDRVDRAMATGDAARLSAAANRITLLAGELAQPFADASDAPVALKVGTAMFLARRMRDALVNEDNAAYDAAHLEFLRVWQDLQNALAAVDPAKVAALDRALAQATLWRNLQAVAELQRAAQDAVASSIPARAQP